MPVFAQLFMFAIGVEPECPDDLTNYGKEKELKSSMPFRYVLDRSRPYISVPACDGLMIRNIRLPLFKTSYIVCDV